MENDVQSKLLSFFKSRGMPRREGNITIPDLVKITDGWENEVYSFKMEYEETGKQEDLILRIYPGDDAIWKSAREFNAMKRLHEVGFPVPGVLLLESGDSPFGKPFVIMEKINGRIMGHVIDRSSEEKRKELVTQSCKMFVALHALDWKLFASDPLPYETTDPFGFIKYTLSSARNSVDRFQRGEFARPVLDWLEARVSDVPCERLSVIHGDYHPYNIILRDDGAAFVIDWGNFGIADFRIDLAWTLLLVSTYGHPEAREIVLDEYERIAGRKVEQIEYFEVFAIARRLFSILMSLSDGATKMGMRPGAEAMMKQNVGHIKTVYALLREKTGIAVPDVETLISNLSG